MAVEIGPGFPEPVLVTPRSLTVPNILGPPGARVLHPTLLAVLSAAGVTEAEFVAERHRFRDGRVSN